MANWVTYLSIEMNPNSARPAAIVGKLTKLGWKPVWGEFDFAWTWGSKWHPNGKNAYYWNTIQKAHKTLQALRVDFSFRTYQKGKETGWTYWH